MPSHTAPDGTNPVNVFRPPSNRHDPADGNSPAPIGVASWSPATPPMTSMRVPVHTDTYPSRTPSGPAASRCHEPTAGS